MLFEDLTEKHKAERESQKRHKLLETIYDTALTGIEIYDRDGYLIDIKNYGVKLLGVIDKGCLKGVNIFENPNLPELYKQELRLGNAVELTIEYDFETIKRANFYKTKASKTKIFEVKISIIRDVNGDIDGYAVLNQDRTKQVLQKIQLNDARTNLQLATKAGGIEPWIYDPATESFQTLNSNLQFTLYQVTDAIHPEDRESNKHLFAALASGKHERATFIFRDTLSSSDYQYYRCTAVAKRDNGKVIKIFGTRKNITKDYTTHQQLIEIKEKLKDQCKITSTVLESINSGLIFIASDCSVKWSNAHNKEHIQPYVSFKHSLSGEECCILAGTNSPKCAECPHKKTVTTNTETTCDYTQNGRAINLHATPVHDSHNHIIGSLLRIDDISDRQEMINSLAESKRRSENSLSMLHNIIEKLPMGLFVKDVDDNFRYILANSKMSMYDVTDISELIGKTDYEIRDAERADNYHRDNMKAVTNNNAPVVNLIRENWSGKYKWYEKTQTVFKTADGRQMLVGIMNDVSERENARIALNKSADNLKEANLVLTNILEHIPVGFFIKDVDDDCRYIMVNQKLADIHHLQISDFLGHSINNIIDRRYISDFISDNEMSVLKNG